MTPIRIIGGGWAGLATAVELTRGGRAVEIFEAAPMLGGRARSVEWQGLLIDNGPHLMLGAYHETLRMIDTVDARSHLDRRPLRLIGPDLNLSVARLPAPLHLAIALLRANGLQRSDKWAAVRLINNLKRRHWTLPHDTPLADWLINEGQPERLIRRLWQPLALAALNTPIAIASAQTFCAILRDSLGGTRAASDAIFSQTSLNTLFCEPARRWLAARGAILHTGQRIKQIDRGTPTVLATHPIEAARLIEGHRELASLHTQLQRLSYQPISNLWLKFATPLRLTYPIQALGEADAPWLFDRQDLATGLVCIVASGAGRYTDMAHTHLLTDGLALLEQCIGPLPTLCQHLVLREHRATFAATPDRPRFNPTTAWPRLWLTGDYTHPEYPATLEGAVQSGVQCARTILHTPP